MLEYLSVWVWGKREQEVMKFKILLTSFGWGGGGAVDGTGSENPFQAIEVSGSHGQGSIPRTWNS